MQADDGLALLKHTIMQGWPSSIKQVPPVLQPYWTFKEEFTVEDGLILKGTRIVIPTKQQEAILKLIHGGHLENLVLNCELCLKYSNSKHKQNPSLLPGQEVPLYPKTKLARDMFHFEGASYLLIVDYTSRFLVVHKLTLMTDQRITSHFKLICSEYG